MSFQVTRGHQLRSQAYATRKVLSPLERLFFMEFFQMSGRPRGDEIEVLVSCLPTSPSVTKLLAYGS